ncbi:carbon storage regulator [Thermoanaerobacterium sp. RBIITD]|uniref:carbon storage regulator n=1 Tax=Thermoanaerobacterium sp. RBIITD TaxID=1550240 RepID=UPI000BB92184|nr:carbon storage regulator [Thermoanaerobacterium sp. RBIITD]SNX53125.1 carbon storage regulator, CsrA [Thermoanaerobacterium sp. RBIITD]
MLILTRKIGQSLIIGDDIEIKILSIDSENISIGITAPKNLSIVRKELLEVRDENKKAININKVTLRQIENFIKKD